MDGLRVVGLPNLWFDVALGSLRVAVAFFSVAVFFFACARPLGRDFAVVVFFVTFFVVFAMILSP
jgi:hypothetical protein